MASRPVEIGPVGRQVAENVTILREHAKLTQQELAERVQSAGRPMSGSVISKIEKLDRRIDVDDLHALAMALGVRPATLFKQISTVVTIRPASHGVDLTEQEGW